MNHLQKIILTPHSQIAGYSFNKNNDKSVLLIEGTAEQIAFITTCLETKALSKSVVAMNVPNWLQIIERLRLQIKNGGNNWLTIDESNVDAFGRTASQHPIDDNNVVSLNAGVLRINKDQVMPDLFHRSGCTKFCF